MKRNNLSVAIAILAAIVIGSWGYNQYLERRNLEVQLGNNYQRAYYDLLGHVQNMQVLLAKGLISSGKEQDVATFSTIWQQASSAQDDLTRLPLPDLLVGQTAKFLTQSGEYARLLAVQSAAGKNTAQENWNTLERLYKQAGDLTVALRRIEEQLSNGSLSLAKLVRETKAEFQRKGGVSFTAEFQSIDRQMENYPSLVYDGPFSDHLEMSKPLGLTGPKITREASLNKSLQVIDRQKDIDYIAQFAGFVGGKIPSYRVEVSPKGNKQDNKVIVNLSQKGGQVLLLLSQRQPGTVSWTIDQAREKAIRFLASLGYKNMVSNYYLQQGNAVTFNFVPLQKGVVIYPDMIKVTVALDNGQIIGLDTTGYLMSHHDRKFPKPRISATEARQRLNPRLKVSKGRLVIIPLPGGKEKLTYEFGGTFGGDTFLIYVNALNGKEERVLKIIDTPEGTLTM